MAYGIGIGLPTYDKLTISTCFFSAATTNCTIVASWVIFPSHWLNKGQHEEKLVVFGNLTHKDIDKSKLEIELLSSVPVASILFVVGVFNYILGRYARAM